MADGVVRGSERSGARRSRDRILGLIIVVVVFLGSLGVSLWAKRAAVSGRGLTATEDAKRLRGWPRDVDPIRVLGAARALSRWNALRTIVATGVRTDGTIDVTQEGRVRYVFEGAPRRLEADKRGARGRPDGFRCSSQTVRLGPEGLRAGPEQANERCPTGRGPSLPEPSCDMAALWKLARAEGAPPDLARIEYSRGLAGARWRLQTTRQAQFYEFSAECKKRVDTPASHRSLQ